MDAEHVLLDKHSTDSLTPVPNRLYQLDLSAIATSNTTPLPTDVTSAQLDNSQETVE
jgi:hypothetical protein